MKYTCQQMGTKDKIKNRIDINDFDKIPNIGSATIGYLNMLGINKPFELIGQNPYSMYRKLCKIAGKKGCKLLFSCMFLGKVAELLLHGFFACQAYSLFIY